jgi:CDP-diacylglycerol--glycerol-3-phosphate 3-phosphatidyltransferase
MKLVTTFGRIADPVADKIIVCGSFAYLLVLGPRPVVQAWMVVLILAREFLVTGVRSFAESHGQAFGALYWGKAKMTIQCVAIVTVLVYLAHFPGEYWARWVANLTVYATVIVTVGSCIPYLRKASGEVRG